MVDSTSVVARTFNVVLACNTSLLNPETTTIHCLVKASRPPAIKGAAFISNSMRTTPLRGRCVGWDESL